MKPLKKIGIDFDNTIAHYDTLFYSCACDAGLISKDIAQNKTTIRDLIRQLPNGNDKWTVLQSIVYGRKMHLAHLATGFSEFISWAKEKGFDIVIISHKSQFPAMGEKTDLRKAALTWMDAHAFFDHQTLGFTIGKDIFFEDTLADKLQRIAQQKCNIFIDDLEEVLSHKDFPKGIEGIHYVNNKPRTASSPSNQLSSWQAIQTHFDTHFNTPNRKPKHITNINRT